MLEVEKISKKAGDFSLKDISFTVSPGEYFVLLGVSGAGKTMLLDIIAGLIKQDSGRIMVDSVDITHIRANKRGTGLVFQDNTVFPHLNVHRNIAYPLVGKGFTKSEIHARVLKWAETIDITHLLDRKPASLSGGELRRVAIARTLAMEPRFLLLDEPLSSLDVLIQYDMMRLLKKLHQSGQTIIHVTHDYNEAYTLADTLAIINSGRVEQTGPPAEVFQHPASRFVSVLAGIRNFFTGIELKKCDGLWGHTIKEGLTIYSSAPCSAGCSIFIREDDIKFFQPGDPAEVNVFDGIITDIIPSPDFYTVVVDAGVNFFVRVANADMKAMNLRSGDKACIKINPGSVRPV
ncbi:MAG TPA: ABC transporter ATP-binding protein [Bacteroidales bacterium]|nr:ABC transporter ATP-binding protein [Bacteroidales bacterium]